MTVKVSAQMCVWRRTLTVYVLFNCREVKKNIFAQNHNLKVFQCKVALTDAKLRGLCTGQLWSFCPEKASLSCVPCNKSWGDTFGRLTPSNSAWCTAAFCFTECFTLLSKHTGWSGVALTELHSADFEQGEKPFLTTGAQTFLGICICAYQHRLLPRWKELWKIMNFINKIRWFLKQWIH